MNKYLLLTAAALAVTGTGTSTSMAAKSGSAVLIIHSGSTTFCDQFDLNWQGIDYEDIHDWTPCGIDSQSQGIGIAGKTKGIGKNVIVSDNYLGDEQSGYIVAYQFELPLKSGNTFYSYSSTGNGITRSLAGYYTIATPGEKHNGPSTIDALRQVIKRHR